MKQLYTLRRTLSAIILLLASALPSYSFEVDGINYSVNENDEIASVRVVSKTPGYSGDIVIPSTVTYEGTTYSVTSIGGSAFYGCTSLTSISIPESVTSIGIYAFRGCTSLTSISIPKSVKRMGIAAFFGCTSLTTISIPESVTSIVDGAFSFCTSLSSISLPEGVTSIGEKSFNYCTSLTTISIPESVTRIRNSAFYDCTSLTTIVCRAKEVPELSTDVFLNVPQSQATLYVHSSAIEAYRAAFQWKDFGKILPLEEYGTGIDSPTAQSADSVYDVYTIQGTLIRKGCNLNGLPAGAYILRRGNESKTVVIK